MTIQTRAGTVLTSADHEHFLEHGYLVIRGAVPPEVIEPAVQLLERESAGSKAVEGREAILEACTTNVILDAISELFGPSYAFVPHRMASDMPRPYNPDRADTWTMEGAHHDQTHPTLVADTAAVRVFIFLTKVKPRGGAFLYAPGSYAEYRAVMQRGPTTHAWGEGPWVRARAGDPDYQPPELEELLAEPGDVLLYHVHMSHSGSDNVSDPQTRHALTTSYAPTRRIDPGDKPFDEMSTIEKACSIRWLRHRFGPQFLTYPVPDGPITEQALAEGFGGSEEIVAHVETRYGGRQHRWFVTAGDPMFIRHATTTDWVRWTEGEPTRVEDGPITSMHHLALMGDVFMTVTTPGSTSVFRTTDYETWTPVSRADGFSATCLFPTSEGLHLFGPHPSDDNGVLRRSGGGDNSDLSGAGMEDLASWTEEAVAATAVGPVASVVVSPISASDFVMLVEYPTEAPHFIRSNEGRTFAGDPRPLSFDAPSTPRGIRIYEQAHHFWLVTYRRGGRIDWGTIDWEDDLPVLREVTTPADLRRALEIVGLV